MSWLSKAVKKVYNATSGSSTKVGRVGKWLAPFNAPYLTRDAWRKVKRGLVSTPTSAGALASTASDSVYGSSGSIVGRF